MVFFSSGFHAQHLRLSGQEWDHKSNSGFVDGDRALGVCLSGRDTKLDPHPASQPHPARTSPVTVPSPAPSLPGGPVVGGKMLPWGKERCWCPAVLW